MKRLHSTLAHFDVLFTLSKKSKVFLVLTTDTFSVIVAYFIAYLLRIDSFPSLTNTHHIFPFLVLLIVSTLLCFGILHTYRIAIRYLTFAAFPPLFIGALASSAILFSLSEYFSIPTPRSIPFIYGILLFCYCLCSRFLVYTIYVSMIYTAKISNAIVYGAGQSGRQLVKALQTGDKIIPVAFVDDNEELQKRTVYGIRVYSPDDIEYLKKKYDVKKLLFAIASATPSRRKEIMNAMVHHNLQMLTLPGISGLAEGEERTTELQEVSLEDLLGRDPIAPIPALLNRHIKGHNVLVTGAGGSIGSELCRQAVAGGARSLVLFELSEIALYSIVKELQGTFPHTPTQLIPILGNVQDKKHLLEIFTSFSVQTVYHAAAYKHVPLVEYNNIAAVKNNVFGTLACIEAAIESKVQHVVAISTDKAVRPTNLMGTTKRIAEMILQTHAGMRDNLDICMVRFGNVLGSSGSVVPLFKKQIAAGGPVTVTHPEITRYFMTIPEAVQLVIQAGSMGNHGEVFVLDMGKPVKIADMAKNMIRLSGLKVYDKDTGLGDIRIDFTGLRPGEKLYEELLIDGVFAETQHPRIMQKDEGSLSLIALQDLLIKLKYCCENGTIPELQELCKVPEIAFHPDQGLKDLLWQKKNITSDNDAVQDEVSI